VSGGAQMVQGGFKNSRRCTRPLLTALWH